MNVIFKNRVKGYIYGLKINIDKEQYDVYMREDNSDDDWEYVCEVDMEKMISNFKSGVWIEVKE